jgi:6-phosphofructokinase
VMGGDASWIAVAASRAFASESSICAASEFALARSRHFKIQSPTPGHVPRSVCVWGPSLLAVFIFRLGNN